jgi:hypothetical protein
MNMSIGMRARLGAVFALAMGLSACFDSDDDPAPVQPGPPQVINTPPTANAGADQVVAAGATVSLSGAASSDSNGTIATYAWTQTSGAAVTLASSGTATPTFTAPAAPGALGFQLTVTDNGGASHSDSVTVTINAPPVASAGTDLTVSAGAAVSLTGTGSDPDGSVATYAWAQTAGPAVTLNNAASANASFTAPMVAADLAFSLTVTDNHGGTHIDVVSVTVTAIIVQPPPTFAPMIGRHPGNALAVEYGSAMFFVAASGTDLTYEWRRSSGVVVKTGPEPFYLQTGLNMHESGDCFYVVISNSAGTATSEQGCVTVEQIVDSLDPSDDQIGDDIAFARGWAGAVMYLPQFMTGPFTGFTGGATHLRTPIEGLQPHQCEVGSYGGVTLDGVLQTTPTSQQLPLGHHTITAAWDNCWDEASNTEPRSDRFMIEYDFPESFREGTMTAHLSNPWIHGTLHATFTTNDANGNLEDEIVVTIAEDFSFGNNKAMSPQEITVDRRYLSGDSQAVDDAYVRVSGVDLRAYEEGGSAGTLSAYEGGFFHLHQEFGGGDDGDPDHTSTGTVVVGTGGDILAEFEPAGGGRDGWHLSLVPPADCPVDVCVELPGAP